MKRHLAAEELPEGAPRNGFGFGNGNGADHLVTWPPVALFGAWPSSCTSVLLAAFIVLNFVLGDREPRVKSAGQQCGAAARCLSDAPVVPVAVLLHSALS